MAAAVLSQVLVPIHRAGWPFIGVFLAVAIILGLLWSPLFWLGLVATAWCVYFFRDPPRVTPLRSDLVVSPADGRVQMIEQVVPIADLEMQEVPVYRVSIFLNIFDVHINRAAIAGRVGVVAYRPGKFLNAALDKASEDNERQAARIDTVDGRSLGLVQIAGLVARRIVCDLKVGQQVKAGERYGLIRFGSRTDIYLPEGTMPLVAVGQRAVGGETVIADLTSDEPQRLGEER